MLEIDYRARRINQMKDELKALQHARKLITDYDNWTQGADARDKGRHAVEVRSKSACKFCSIGSVVRSIYDLGFEFQPRPLVERLNRSINPFHGYGSIVSTNDSERWVRPRQETHRLVLSAFDVAIKDLRKEITRARAEAKRGVPTN